jgi:hypothetical protein
MSLVSGKTETNLAVEDADFKENSPARGKAGQPVEFLRPGCPSYFLAVPWGVR